MTEHPRETRQLLAPVTETALLAVSTLLLAVGAAAIPTAVLGLAGNSGLVTGDPPHPRLASALTADHIQEAIRGHLLAGWLGFLILAAWWLVHVRRQARPSPLPAGFTIAVCSTLLGIVAAFMLVFGIIDVSRGADSAAGLIGSGDLVATGATVMVTSAACWLTLVRRAVSGRAVTRLP